MAHSWCAPGKTLQTVSFEWKTEKHTRAPRTVPYATGNEHQIRTRLAGLKSFITPPTGTGSKPKKKDSLSFSLSRSRFATVFPFPPRSVCAHFPIPFPSPFSRQAGPVCTRVRSVRPISGVCFFPLGILLPFPRTVGCLVFAHTHAQ